MADKVTTRPANGKSRRTKAPTTMTVPKTGIKFFVDIIFKEPAKV